MYGRMLRREKESSSSYELFDGEEKKTEEEGENTSLSSWLQSGIPCLLGNARNHIKKERR